MSNLHQENHISPASFVSIKLVVLSTLFALTLYYLVGFSFTPESFEWGDISLLQFFYFLFIDQLLIEGVFIAGLLILMSRYASYFRLTKVPQTVSEVGVFLIRYLPFFLLVFFILNPITQTFRYILRNGSDLIWDVYIDEYVLNIPLYITYTFFSMLIGYSVIIAKLFQAMKNPAERTVNIPDRIVGEFEAVSSPVLFTEMMWITVEDRKYWAQTLNKKVRLHKKINELEELLPTSLFFRINRSTIVNINYIDTYTSWESGTYIIEMKAPQEEEFVISRGRVKAFKKLMGVG